MKAIFAADMEIMSSEENEQTLSAAEPVRRQGERRVLDQVVADDRRKHERRKIPGVSALIRTLFRRETGTKS